MIGNPDKIEIAIAGKKEGAKVNYARKGPLRNDADRVGQKSVDEQSERRVPIKAQWKRVRGGCRWHERRCRQQILHLANLLHRVSGRGEAQT